MKTGGHRKEKLRFPAGPISRFSSKTRRRGNQAPRRDFDRVVVTHGDVLEHGGRAALAQGYLWLLDSGESGMG